MLATKGPSSLAYIADYRAMESLFTPGVDGLVCKTELPVSARRQLDTADPAHWPRVRIVAPLDRVPDCLASVFGSAGFPDGPLRDWLVCDLRDQATALASLLNLTHIRFRFDCVTDDACRLFHIDNVVARLVKTYRGPGTQLLVDCHDGNSSQEVNTGAGESVLLKGRQWPGEHGERVKHRSPAIAGSGISRFVVAIEGVWPDATPLGDRDTLFG